MITFLKSKIAAYIVDKQLRLKQQGEQSFSNFFSSSFSFFVIMPDEEKDFNQSFRVLNFLDERRKNPVIFIHDFRVSLLPLKFRQNVLERDIGDINKLNLPAKAIQNKLLTQHYDVAIDLNRAENLYSSFAANLVQAPVRIGFKKPGSDRYYNLQILNNEESAEISYKNFLNCLGMF